MKIRVPNPNRWKIRLDTPAPKIIRSPKTYTRKVKHKNRMYE